ncbi:MAG: ATP-grasp domain-containing protein [Acidimicrobiales bacterium]
MQPTMAIVACQAWPNLNDDWPVLAAALTRRGVDARVEVWTDDAVDWDSYDLVVVRGTWDYVERLSQFRKWVGRVEPVGAKAGAGGRLVNPSRAILWNLDKRYLDELGAAGVPVVTTAWVTSGDNWQPPAGEYVVKPAVSLGSLETARYRPGEEADASGHVARLLGANHVVMVQPFYASVDDEGEASLVYLGGRFSHAMRKAPLLERGAGVRDDLGPRQRVTPLAVAAEHRRVADPAVAACEDRTGPLAYARVDLFRDDEGRWLVNEVELIEPWLFLAYAEGAADRFADVLVSLLPS